MGVRIEDRTDKIVATVNRALRTGVEAAAAFVEGRAKELCPVDTGTLRRSIHTEMQPQTSPTRAQALVGPDTPYDIYVEYGTSRMRAQPFMRPAFDETVEDQKDIIREFVQEAIMESVPHTRRSGG